MEHVGSRFYYHRHFQPLPPLVLQFDAMEATAIKASQLKFQDPQVETNLQTLCNHYQEITNVIMVKVFVIVGKTIANNRQHASRARKFK